MEDLIKGLPAVLKKYSGVCCLLVGRGSLKPTIETLTKGLGGFDSCVFTGAVSYSEVGAYLAAMDLCVTAKALLNLAIRYRSSTSICRRGGQLLLLIQKDLNS